MKPKHEGSRSYGETWRDWYYFYQVPIQDVMNWVEDNLVVSYNGPGQEFAERPSFHSVGKRILVTQRCGLDV